MQRVIRSREGFALMMVMVIVVIMGSVVAAASFMTSTSFTLASQHDRRGSLISAAEEGIERARGTINGNRGLYPDSSYVTLENGVPVLDASGAAITGLRRWLYVGPSGITTGQYGVFGSVVAVVEDGNGDRIVRRGEVEQASFARYAYFTDLETSPSGGIIYFAGGDQLFGPVHSNDEIWIHSTGATFHSTVTTAQTIEQSSNGTFMLGFTEGVQPIPMPTTADLNKLRNYAQTGNSYVAGSTAGATGQATVRIEFINIDLDGDTEPTGPDEGFMRVYQSSNAAWVTAHRDGSGLEETSNCGHFHGTTFFRVNSDASHSDNQTLTTQTPRCFPGGSDVINNGFSATDAIGPGAWLAYPGPAITDPRFTALIQPDKAYLWPLSRTLNPDFHGVVFVDGKVAISGTLRARITLAATDAIIIADDVRYSVDPSAGSCTDMLGLFSGADVIVADNTINTPQSWNGNWRSYDESTSEFIQGVVLALNTFMVENHANSPSDAEDCGTTDWGRGCLFLTGGIIQRRRGAVGQANGNGFLKRYDYDQCVLQDPPPYFPTTGWFLAGRIFEINPMGFDINALFAQLTPN